MNCETCGREPEWQDFPAPDGWKVLSRGFVWETWRCPDHHPALIQQRQRVKTKRGWAYVNMGEGYDHDRQRGMLGEKLDVVPELSGHDIVWPKEWTKPWGVRGLRAPTVDSLNDLGRRREFMRQNPRFTEM